MKWCATLPSVANYRVASSNWARSAKHVFFPRVDQLATEARNVDR